MKDKLFRFGLAVIFLANSLTAWFLPDEFREIILISNLASKLGNTDILVNLIVINDGLLFLLLVLGVWRKPVAIWGLIWILMVIFVTGFLTPDFVEHIGVILLLAGYYFSKNSSS